MERKHAMDAWKPNIGADPAGHGVSVHDGKGHGAQKKKNGINEVEKKRTVAIVRHCGNSEREKKARMGECGSF